MPPRPLIAVSSCLLGSNVRYDGGHKRHAWIAEVLAQSAELVALCPEVEMGLGVPRRKIRRVGHSELHVIDGLVVAGAETTCRHLVDRLEHISGVILKSRSPSCGLSVDVFADASSSAPTARGRGLFAAVLLDSRPGLPVAEETDLPDDGTFLGAVLQYAQAQR